MLFVGNFVIFTLFYELFFKKRHQCVIAMNNSGKLTRLPA